MQSRCVKIVLCGVLSLVATWATLDATSVPSSQHDGSPQVEIAARYHLRSRTSKFYQRSKTGQVRKSRAA